MPSFEGNLFTSGTKLPRKKLETLVYHGEDPESLSPGIESVPGRDRQTEFA